MNEELKIKLKEKFEKGNYEFFPYIVENDILQINLSNYKKILVEVINIFNEVRSNRFIDEQDKFYASEKMFANHFFETCYNAIKRHENLDELTDEVHSDLKQYYHFIKNINSVGQTYKEDDDDEKDKQHTNIFS